MASWPPELTESSFLISNCILFVLIKFKTETRLCKGWRSSQSVQVYAVQPAKFCCFFPPIWNKSSCKKNIKPLPFFLWCNYHVLTGMRASSMIVLGTHFIFNHQNLVSVSLKSCDCEISRSSWLLARSAWVTSNKHVVRESERKGGEQIDPPGDASREQASEFDSNWPQIIHARWATPTMSSSQSTNTNVT